MKLQGDNFLVEIDQKSGFCFGVVNAIEQAEKELEANGTLYCLGDIVHNSKEVERLERIGLKTITHEEFEKLHDVTVLLRAHGEPPRTYEIAQKNNITLIDATCKVVLRLQDKIRKGYLQSKDDGAQVVIYGKHGHAEVNGLVGQTSGEAVVVENSSKIPKLDTKKPVVLFSQTTKSWDGLMNLADELKLELGENNVQVNDTICRQVINRVPHLKEFSKKYDTILFVSGKKSSNGKMLFEDCKRNNPRSYMISEAGEIDESWLRGISTVGVCGATSTPIWLMEDVGRKAYEILDELN